MVELGEAVFAFVLGVAAFVEMGVQLPKGGLDLGKLLAHALPCLLECLLGLGDVGVLASRKLALLVLASPKLITFVFRLPKLQIGAG